jgi:hypothetical protein
MFFVSSAIFHLSVSCPFIVYDLVKLWSAAALVTDRPPAPTQTNRTYYYQSIYIRYEGLFCLILFKCSPITDTVSRWTRSRQCRQKCSPVADPVSEEVSSRQWRQVFQAADTVSHEGSNRKMQTRHVLTCCRHCLSMNNKQTMQTSQVLTCCRQQTMSHTNELADNANTPSAHLLQALSPTNE